MIDDAFATVWGGAAIAVGIGWMVRMVMRQHGVYDRIEREQDARFERERAAMRKLLDERARTQWQRQPAAPMLDACAYCGRAPEPPADGGHACAGCGAARFLRRG